MKYLTRIAFALGVAVLIVLVIREGAQSIAGLLRQAGWPLLLLVPLHIAPLLLDVMGWRVLILDQTRIASLFSIAAIREAINRLLPVANVGGELVGIRLLARHGVSGTMAAASVVIEMLLNIAAQYVFLALGLLLLLSDYRQCKSLRCASPGDCGSRPASRVPALAVEERKAI